MRSRYSLTSRWTLHDTVKTIFGVTLVLVVVGIIYANVKSYDPGYARTQANQWSTQLGIQAKGVTCAGRDTDGDGYVSCTVADLDGKIHHIECASYTYNSGCRAPKPVAPYIP